ncbi:MAG: ScyD/ScyE family protein [Jiangellaceae bacterium]|nr:ScyD/ScyE family protein [Jiangellaceae bacterium]
MRRKNIATAMTAATAMFCLTASMALPAAAQTVSDPIVGGMAGPLSLAVGSDGTVYVAQSFAGTLTAIDKKGGATDLASVPGASLSGVEALGRGTVTYTTRVPGGPAPVTSAGLWRVQPNGKVRLVADLLAFEEENNPDQVNSYGFQDLTPECAAQVPEEIGGEPYTGIVDSHPYSVLLSDGSWIVADAGGNDILRVQANGEISVVAVLSPQPFVVMAEVAEAQGLPECTIGSTYNFEPVPTDVELGPDGLLYVTLLPGGPEDPSLGARGSVYSIDPDTGEVALVASGFLGATGLAVAPDGTIYVAELFGNRISTVSGAGAEPFVEVPSPAAVEWANGVLYATIDVFGNGSVVTITP